MQAKSSTGSVYSCRANHLLHPDRQTLSSRHVSQQSKIMFMQMNVYMLLYILVMSGVDF